ncbi:MAG TPA: MFS transporter [Acidimicrobiales bacterium]
MSDHDSDGPGRPAHPRFRWLMAFHGCSAAGQTLGTVAVVAVVYRQTHDPTMVSLVAGARLVPYLLGSGLAGTIADRHDRAAVLARSTLARLVLCGALAVAVAVGAGPWVLIGVTLLLTAAGTFCYPAVVASVPALVADEHLVASNAILTSIETAAFIVGPALGGALLLVGSPSHALIVDTVLFGLAALLLRPVGALPATTVVEAAPMSLLAALGDGVRTIARRRQVTAPMTLVVVVNLVYGSSLVALVLVAEDRFASGGHGFGVLSAAFGVGALIGVVVASRVGSGPRPLRTIAAATACAGLPFAALAIGAPAAVGVALVMFSGAGSIVAEVMAVTVVQRHVPAAMTARVFGLLDMVIIGAIFAGSTVTPALIRTIGLPGALLLLGAGLPLVACTVVLYYDPFPATEPAFASRAGSGLLGAEVDGA